MLTGGGLFSGLGGISSIIGLLLQVGLIIIVVRLAMSWWQRRHTPASAYASGPAPAAEGPGAQSSFRSGLGGFGLGSSQPALEIQPADYEAFERLLGEVQAAWSNEDVAKLHTLATPEMVSYFSKDLEENKARNDVNKVTDVKLRRATSPKPGAKAKPISPAWRCGSRWSTRPWSAPPAVWSRAATRRPRPLRCGPSPAGAAPIGNSRRSSRPADRLHNDDEGAAACSAAPFSLSCPLSWHGFTCSGRGAAFIVLHRNNACRGGLMTNDPKKQGGLR
jgi:hypothetical protein